MGKIAAIENCRDLGYFPAQNLPGSRQILLFPLGIKTPDLHAYTGTEIREERRVETTRYETQYTSQYFHQWL